MKVLYKSDTDYIALPSNDPFVQKNQAFLIEMGYKLIEDWEPPTIDEPSQTVSEVTETVTETVEETAEETTDDSVIVINGKAYTKTELKKLLE
jgi:hypothetical protein